MLKAIFEECRGVLCVSREEWSWLDVERAIFFEIDVLP